MTDDFKIFDRIYGYCKFPPLVKAIVNTPQFQRLRCIKQLGTSYFLNINAVHTRFEHCIGTARITSQLIHNLRKKSNDRQIITKKEELCLIIAGLCHDLGHGPFSHLFNRVAPPEWSHEEMSILMLRRIFEQNLKVKTKFSDYGLDESHLHLITSMIRGEADPLTLKTFFSSKIKKYFLLEIVCNNDHGIDTDKLDYMMRDSVTIPIQCPFSFPHVLDCFSLINKGDAYHLGFDKCFAECFVHFHSFRFKLHKEAYRHQKVLGVELMLAEALKIADPVIKFTEACFDPERFEMLTDAIIYEILRSEDSRLSESRNLIERIFRREFYKCAGIFPVPKTFEHEDKLELYSSQLKQFLKSEHPTIDIQSVKMELSVISYPKGVTSDPLQEFNLQNGETPFFVENGFLSFKKEIIAEKNIFIFYM